LRAYIEVTQKHPIQKKPNQFFFQLILILQL